MSVLLNTGTHGRHMGWQFSAIASESGGINVEWAEISWQWVPNSKRLGFQQVLQDVQQMALARAQKDYVVADRLRTRFLDAEAAISNDTNGRIHVCY